MSERHVATRGRPPPRLLAWAVALALLACGPAAAAADEYEVPDPVIKAFNPKGLSVSIPDSEGVELFAFHGNVNRELGEREAGEMSVDIRKKKDGLWTYHNAQRRLKVGDVINYWLYVQRFGRGYEQLGQTFVVQELVEAPAKVTPKPAATPIPQCDLSPTEVNGRPVCKGQVVFEDDFKSLDLSRWSHEVKISGAPDYEFCVYTQNTENTFTQKGFLHLSPTLTNDKYGADFVRTGKLQLDGCTAGAPNSDSCSREAMFSYILPPILASRINTKNSFSFKYGTIEIRARLPRGDWIYPELWLQSTREEYGTGLASGRVVLAMARGNRRLTGPAPDHADISGKVMVAGALAGNINEGSATAKRKIFAKRSELGLWTEQFHNYTLLWTPDTLAFSVDGIEIGVVRAEDVSLFHGERDTWSQGSGIAPFDKEFYLSLGLAVGGVHAFPDGCRSGNHDKPWKNTGAKAMLNFWNNREVWHSTWNGQSDLLVDSVRVTALNN